MVKSYLKSAPKGFQTITTLHQKASIEVYKAYQDIMSGYREVTYLMDRGLNQEALNVMCDAVWADYPDGVEDLLDEDPEYAHLMTRAWTIFDWAGMPG